MHVKIAKCNFLHFFFAHNYLHDLAHNHLGAKRLHNMLTCFFFFFLSFLFFQRVLAGFQSCIADGVDNVYRGHQTYTVCDTFYKLQPFSEHVLGALQ